MGNLAGELGLPATRTPDAYSWSMPDIHLEQGAVYQVEESRGFGNAPAVYDEVQFTAERTVVNWWVQEIREAMPTVVQEFVTDTGALVLVPTKHLVSARQLRTAD